MQVSKSCWKCATEFSCGANSASGCWCEKYPPLPPLDHRDCLCPDCLGRAIAERQPKRALVLGDDYYLEGAAVVFTAAYHLRRGYCCGNRCRHCPYDK